MESTTTSTQTLQVQQDWNNDGFLRITGARTIRRYIELEYELLPKLPVDKWGIFFAFSQQQFDDGYKGLLKRGLIAEGEKVKHFGGGCYGITEAMKRWAQEAKAIEDQIRAECDPYEVYLEEYNNYECCIDWDGDDRAVEKVISIFGLERTRKAIQGRRFRALSPIEDIAEAMKKN